MSNEEILNFDPVEETETTEETEVTVVDEKKTNKGLVTLAVIGVAATGYAAYKGVKWIANKVKNSIDSKKNYVSLDSVEDEELDDFDEESMEKEEN